MTKQEVYDAIRQSWVAATPEEIVRQRLIRRLVESLGFPQEYISVEIELGAMPHLKSRGGLFPDRRSDIVCFAKGIHQEHSLYPLLLIECKDRSHGEQAKEQVIGYNHHVGAYFVAVASQAGEEFGYYDQALGRHHFISHIPSYEQLLSSLKKLTTEHN